MRWLRGHCVTESIGQMTGRVQPVMRISCEGEVEVAGPVSRTRMFVVWVCLGVCVCVCWSVNDSVYKQTVGNAS